MNQMSVPSIQDLEVDLVDASFIETETVVINSMKNSKFFKFFAEEIEKSEKLFLQ